MLKQFKFKDIKIKQKLKSTKWRKIKSSTKLDHDCEPNIYKNVRSALFSIVTIKEDQIAGKLHRIVQIQATISIISSSIWFSEIQMLKQFKFEHIKINQSQQNVKNTFEPELLQKCSEHYNFQL
jgi:hypothetical protein